jgi:hypothetical protein
VDADGIEDAEGGLVGGIGAEAGDADEAAEGLGGLFGEVGVGVAAADGERESIIEPGVGGEGAEGAGESGGAAEGAIGGDGGEELAGVGSGHPDGGGAGEGGDEIEEGLIGFPAGLVAAVDDFLEVFDLSGDRCAGIHEEDTGAVAIDDVIALVAHALETGLLEFGFEAEGAAEFATNEDEGGAIFLEDDEEFPDVFADIEAGLFGEAFELGEFAGFDELLVEGGFLDAVEADAGDCEGVFGDERSEGGVDAGEFGFPAAGGEGEQEEGGEGEGEETGHYGVHQTDKTRAAGRSFRDFTETRAEAKKGDRSMTTFPSG